ncbi:MAG: hypothetical protein H6993_11380 [Pseudomonadales bacterium]|nr:hypothetical protein [Pseudomonadales bacterium]
MSHKCFLLSMILIVAASSANADIRLSYNEISIGYAVHPISEDGVPDLTGGGLSGTWSPVDRLFFAAGYERFGLHTSQALGAVDLTATAKTLTVGTWFALRENLHLTLEVGGDYETIEVSAEGITESDNDFAANGIVGLRYLIGKRVELSAQLQRLQDIQGNGESRWVYITSASLALTDHLDLGGYFSRESGENTYILGARWRF